MEIKLKTSQKQILITWVVLDEKIDEERKFLESRHILNKKGNPYRNGKLFTNNQKEMYWDWVRLNNIANKFLKFVK